MKLIIGNKNYSSWSLRGWLAAKQSGLHFEEIIVPLLGEQWEQRKQDDQFQPSSGKVPILWDEDNVIWDSLAIMEYLGDKVGAERYWPKDPAARGMARSMVAEMHSSYSSLRSEMPMNVRRRIELKSLSDQTKEDIVRILGLWAEARASRWIRPVPVRYLWGCGYLLRAGRIALHHLWDRHTRICAKLYASHLGA